MLSICIPVYNKNVVHLVQIIDEQAKNMLIEYEIVVFDDGSDERFKSENRVIASSQNVKYHELVKNVGRSAIRNLLANTAVYENILFLDCDSMPVSDNFIRAYTEILDSSQRVICGGRAYPESVVKINKNLRRKYGLKRESSGSKKRNQNPYFNFRTNNFLIKKSIFKNIEFNDKLLGYGHEDTLFGFQLSQLNINVYHISNPVYHTDEETNTEFLQKTKSAIRNLHFLVKSEKEFMNWIVETRLLKIYFKSKKYGLHYFLASLYLLVGPAVYLLLKSGIASLFLFDFYKLAYFSYLNLTK